MEVNPTHEFVACCNGVQTVSTMASVDAVAAHTAAQVVAAIGAIELRTNQWKELIPGLLSTVNKVNLECLGYLCEELVRVMRTAPWLWCSR